jgi:hypothetical protein
VFFSLFLLFGPPIQQLAAMEPGDIVFGIIRNAMLGFFIADLIARCFTDKDYFVCSFDGGGNSNFSPGAAMGGMSGDVKGPIPCEFGSFLFWCDLVSTLAILYDLSYVNPAMYDVKELEIRLDADGIPVRKLINNVVVLK